MRVPRRAVAATAKMAATLSAAFGLAVSLSSPAAAHYVYFEEYVWANADSSRCLMNYSETSHGSTGGGYFKGEARSQYDPDISPLDCNFE